MNLWLLWYLGPVLGVFATLEIRARLTGRPTLSRTVWRLQAQYPIFGFAFGVIVGGLAVHFFGFIPACKP